jgi:hypothetical protein
MNLRDFYQHPKNILQVPAGAWQRIEQEASLNGGVVKLFFSIPIQYPSKGEMRWKSVWQLIDYSIETDEIERMYPYTLTKQKGQMPEPKEEYLQGRKFFGPTWLPKAAMRMLKGKVRYYKTGAKQA